MGQVVMKIKTFGERVDDIYTSYMKSASWGIQYCPHCGSKVKVKRKPYHDHATGELLGWHLDIACKKWWRLFSCGLGTYWGYEGVDAKLVHDLWETPLKQSKGDKQ